jgi:hypothetical protein
MDVLNQKQWLKSTNCVVVFFSIFFEIFRNFLVKRFEFFEFFEKIFFEKWTTSSVHWTLSFSKKFRQISKFYFFKIFRKIVFKKLRKIRKKL